MKFKISNSIFILFLFIILFGGCDCQTPLEGSWIGYDIRRPFIDWNLTIRGNEFVLMREDFNLWYKGQFKLNNNCALKKIDFEINNTQNLSLSGKTLLGIYEINGDTLTFITSEPHKQLRPLSFDEPNEAVIFNFVRS